MICPPANLALPALLVCFFPVQESELLPVVAAEFLPLQLLPQLVEHSFIGTLRRRFIHQLIARAFHPTVIHVEGNPKFLNQPVVELSVPNHQSFLNRLRLREKQMALPAAVEQQIDLAQLACRQQLVYIVLHQ